MNDSSDIVIVGGGHAAAQLCAGLADAGRGAQVRLVCEEDVLPYQRPPLSKAFLKNTEEVVQPHRAESWFADAGIRLHLADPAITIDRAAQTLSLRTGKLLRYHRLVLATGTRARRLPHLPEHLDNVAVLRHADDAARLRRQMHAAQHLTVLGGGFIGLEIAATARVLGKTVTVLESAPRLLMRSVSPEIAEHVLASHRAAGVDVRLGVAVGGFEFDNQRLHKLAVDGVPEAVELLVLAVGAAPEEGLARAAGLDCANGIVVDAFMQTSDPAILAIGDCTSFPEPGSGRRLRLESVQNANDQARTALATLLGTPAPYTALPWFWSEQASLRLQMAGLLPAGATRALRPGANAGSFSVLHYLGERFVCIESVNAAMDHVMSRKLLEAGKSPPLAAACDPAVPLKRWL